MQRYAPTRLRIVFGVLLSLAVVVLIALLGWRVVTQNSAPLSSPLPVATTASAAPTGDPLAPPDAAATTTVEVYPTPAGDAPPTAVPPAPEGPIRKIVLSDSLSSNRGGTVLVGMYGDTPCWNSAPRVLACSGTEAAWSADLEVEIIQIASQRANSPLCAVLKNGKIWCFRPDPVTGEPEGEGKWIRTPAPLYPVSLFGDVVCGIYLTEGTSAILCDEDTNAAGYSISGPNATVSGAGSSIMSSGLQPTEGWSDVFLSSGTDFSVTDPPSEGPSSICVQAQVPVCSFIGGPFLAQQLRNVVESGYKAKDFTVTPEGIACISLEQGQMLCSIAGDGFSGVLDKVQLDILVSEITAGTSGEQGQSYSVCGLSQSRMELQCAQLQDYPIADPVVFSPAEIAAMAVGATRGVVVTADYRLGFFDLPK